MLTTIELKRDLSSEHSSWFDQVEGLLETVIPSADTPPQPLHRAMRHAVLTGGKRLRPWLVLAVADAARANGLHPSEVDLILRSACAIELVHAASLVHDDLPCFDDAKERRGAPTVHSLYGEPIAILTGDALVCLAFETMAGAAEEMAGRAMRITRLLAAASGSREGLIGGQSIEQPGAIFEFQGCGVDAKTPCYQPHFPDILDRYHAMKSAALFKMAAEAGALAAGATELFSWGEIGRCFGLAFQLVDDLCDCMAESKDVGKPVRKDAQLGRLNAVLRRGEQHTRSQVQALWAQARQLAQTHARHSRLLFHLFDQLTDQMERLINKAAQTSARHETIQGPQLESVSLDPQAA